MPFFIALNDLQVHHKCAPVRVGHEPRREDFCSCPRLIMARQSCTRVIQIKQWACFIIMIYHIPYESVLYLSNIVLAARHVDALHVYTGGVVYASLRTSAVAWC
jgi:hypothetical protein